jgi:hypothetical protein
MSYSRKHFQLCRVFLDETEVPWNGKRYFMWGALLLPIDCDLQLKLGKLRKDLGFLHTVHFSDGKQFSDKEEQFIIGALKAFKESTGVFRAILASNKEWAGVDTKNGGQASLAGQLLSYPWMPYEKDIYCLLSRPRIIFDRLSINHKQEELFINKVNEMLLRPNKLPKASVYPIKDATVTFADKKIFDELQLIDIINGITRVSYLLMANKNNIPSSKLKLHNNFLVQFPELVSFVRANRKLTEQKINIWHLLPRKGF